MADLKWELIEHDNSFSLARANIFGGWLVRSVNDVQTPSYEGYEQPINRIGYEWRTSIAFVPDPNHEWKID